MNDFHFEAQIFTILVSDNTKLNHNDDMPMRLACENGGIMARVFTDRDYFDKIFQTQPVADGSTASAGSASNRTASEPTLYGPTVSDVDQSIVMSMTETVVDGGQ